MAPPEPAVDDRGAVIGYGLTWVLGRLARARGAGGLIVPSAALPAQRMPVVLERAGTTPGIHDRRPIPTDPRMRRILGP